jgi:hypothetical protein
MPHMMTRQHTNINQDQVLITYNSGFLVDRIHVDPRVESDTGRSIRIFLVTKELDSVNAPFMN